MGCMLRSDPMTQFDMFLPPDTAFIVLSIFGEEGNVQFYDLNEHLNAFQRSYVQEICRCADMERRLYYIGDRMREENIYVPKVPGKPAAVELHEMNAYEVIIERWERHLVEMSINLTQLNKTYLEMWESSYVFTHIGGMLGDADLSSASGLWAAKQAAKGRKGALMRAAALESGARLSVLTGLVQRKRCFSFQLMLWRIARGNAYYKQTEEDHIFKDPYSNVDMRKVAFLLVVQGEELGVRMRKVCEGFHCDLFAMPLTAEERTSALMALNLKIMDLSMVLRETKLERCKAMRAIGRLWRTYLIKIKKAKAIYHEMNFFTLDITKNCLIGRCWMPTADVDKVQAILNQCSERSETAVPCFMSVVENDETPPTFHRTNRFTHGFQVIISAYGDSMYRELNPGLYTIVTFPFLFSLMFGDMGHAAIMFLGALWMIVKEKQFMEESSDSDIWNTFFGGRYIMFLMGAFSMFSGVIYNDCFSKSFNIFGYGWKLNKTLEELFTIPNYLLEPTDADHTYYIGKDPIWELSSNRIQFENSLKMKFSIIIGVIHMTFGLCLSFFNYIYFKQKYLIFLQFLPQLIFLLAIYMWLVVLIFFKWFKYGGATPPSIKEEPVCAPLVLILFIDMFLFTTTKPLGPECDAYMFDGQQSVQEPLIIIAVVCIPIMLFGPPCYKAQSSRKKRAALQKKMPDEEYQPEEYAAWKKKMEHLSETFGDYMIHQAVHTIEFVLSTISHTASYLRLWALSLAHAQLSEMLWSMIFSKMALSDHSLLGALRIVVVFAIWAFFTMAILVIMEGLSAFLHTLRLHWVEFMSKFFMGGGIMFKPFCFSTLFSDTSKEKLEVCPALKTYEY